MRYIKFLGLFVMVTAIFSLNSCKKWIDEDLNVDPNNPATVPYDLLLAGAQAGQAFLYGGDISRYCAVVTQHQAGIARQHLTIGQYLITESDVDNAWRFNMYAGPMKDYVVMIAQADDIGSPHYAGIARILLANMLGAATDLWGSVPYSEAFLGFDNLTPVYDSEADIYAEIQTLLTDAIANLNEGTSVKSPSAGEDLIYGGDLTRWIQTANALKARYHNHGSNIDPMGSATAALAAIDAGGYGSNADDCDFFFGNAVVEENPWYQFNDQRGDVAMGEFFVDLMLSLSDPRIDVFADSSVSGGVYIGSPAGSPISGPSAMGSYYGSPASPVPFVSYVEQLFIEAEAALRANDLMRAADAHNAAVEASLDKFGTPSAAYLAANANESGASITLAKIMEQKYIAMYTQMETWTDFRRTGEPASMVPAANAQTPGGGFPNRWPYPESENLFNASNVPSIADLTVPMWFQ